MNLFVAIVVVGFGDQKGQIDIIEKDNRELAMRRFAFMRTIKEKVYKTLSIDLCGFPGPRCEKAGLSLWQHLPFRQDIVRNKAAGGRNARANEARDEEDEEDREAGDTGAGAAEEVVVINHDYVEIPKSVRGIARHILGAVDWGFLGADHPLPQLADVERIIKDLTTARVVAKKRGADGQVQEVAAGEGEEADKGPVLSKSRSIRQVMGGGLAGAVGATSLLHSDCVCVCVCVCVCLHTCIRMYICIYLCIYLCMCICICE